MAKHISGDYDNELDSLRASFSTLGGYIEQQLHSSMQAFLTNDSSLAAEVRERELEINRLSMNLDQQATNVIALRQPAASDLRLVVSILKNSTDLERIGDETDRIAKFTERLGMYDSSRLYHADLTKLHSRVVAAVQTSLNVFARGDVDTALRSIGADKEVDALYDSVVQQVTREMTEDPVRVNNDLSIIWVARSLERIGDHSKNICETVVYAVRGQTVVHNISR